MQTRMWSDGDGDNGGIRGDVNSDAVNDGHFAVKARDCLVTTGSRN